MNRTIPKYGVRRFATYRDDGRCFELYLIATGECASFPGTKKRLIELAKAWNVEQKEAALA